MNTKIIIVRFFSGCHRRKRIIRRERCQKRWCFANVTTPMWIAHPNAGRYASIASRETRLDFTDSDEIPVKPKRLFTVVG